MNDPTKASGRTTGSALAPRLPVADFALVLGGGGTKGLAHIVAIEAIDELGISPREVAGTSIGAIIGAGYAAGMSGRDLRAYALDLLRIRPETLKVLLGARVGRFADLIRTGLTNPVLIDAERFLGSILPPIIPRDFESLPTPLAVVATDYHARVDIAFRAGTLIPAIAGSMAIPGAFKPVLHQSRVLIDGGTINPVPVDCVSAPIVLAVDVLDTSSAVRNLDITIPDAWEAVFGSVTLMMQVLGGARIAAYRPAVLIRPPVDDFKVLEFFKAKEILAACDGMKDEVKRKLTLALEATPAEIVTGK